MLGIRILKEKTETQDNFLWRIIFDNVDSVKYKISAMEETITYNDFYWGNLIVHKELQNTKKAIVFDYNLMGIRNLERDFNRLLELNLKVAQKKNSGGIKRFIWT